MSPDVNGQRVPIYGPYVTQRSIGLWAVQPGLVQIMLLWLMAQPIRLYRIYVSGRCKPNASHTRSKNGIKTSLGGVVQS